MSKNKNPNEVAPQSLTDLQTLAATGDEMAKSLLEHIEGGDVTLEAALAQLQKGESTVEDLVKGCAAGQGKAPPTMSGPAGQEGADGGKKDKLSKQEGEDEEEEEEEEEEKSLDQGDLVKAVQVASQVAAGAETGVDPDRRATLAKSLTDGSITPEEEAELAGLLSGGGDLDEPLERSYTDVGMQDPDVQAGHATGEDFDVSAFLGRFVAFVGNSLDEINTGLGKSLGRVHGYNKAQASVNEHLAKALMDTGKLVKGQSAVIDALGQRLGAVESQPVGRRSVPAARALDKSTKPAGGQPYTTDQPNAGPLGPPPPGMDIRPDQIVKGLTMLQRQSPDGKSPSGHDISTATAHFETHRQIHPDVVADVKQVLGK